MLLSAAAFSVSAQTTVRTLQWEGTTRSYRLHLPPDYSSSTALPLIINMHGLGSNAWQQEAYSGMNNIADTAAFVVAYPDGLQDAASQTTYWNCGFMSPYHSGSDDVGFIQAMMDSISAQYNIDQDRIYACGMSMGGFMSYRLACELEERIAAIASVTGVAVDSVFHYCQNTRPVPLLHIHGTADSTVPYEGGAGLGGTIMMPVQEAVNFWVARNQCPELPPQITDLADSNTADGCTATHTVYTSCEKGSRVELYRINGGAHTWPGAPISIGVTNQDFNASETIWLFFKDYRRSQFAPDTATALAAVNPLLYNIAPNPFEENLSIQTEEAATVMITDMNGKLLLQQHFAAAAKETIATQHWNSGLYAVCIIPDKKGQASVHKKIIKP
ncbi:MAG: T9SS type A sorting domain-containing protein [Sphingobacteriales bacterium]|nr:T9SS type A sorting domain-containing protein [Sphingobacteriales bacterium]